MKNLMKKIKHNDKIKELTSDILTATLGIAAGLIVILFLLIGGLVDKPILGFTMAIMFIVFVIALAGLIES